MVEDDKKDIKQRVDDFNVELKGLLKKYRLALLANPGFTTDGRIVAFPQVIDEAEIKKEPEVQPEQPETKEQSGLAEA